MPTSFLSSDVQSHTLTNQSTIHQRELGLIFIWVIILFMRSDKKSKEKKTQSSWELTGLKLPFLLYCNALKPSYFNAIQYMQFFQIQTKYLKENNQIPWNTSSKQILFNFIKAFILSYKKCPYQCHQFTYRHANLSRICRVRNEISVLSVEYPCNWNLLVVLYHP